MPQNQHRTRCDRSSLVRVHSAGLQHHNSWLCHQEATIHLDQVQKIFFTCRRPFLAYLSAAPGVQVAARSISTNDDGRWHCLVGALAAIWISFKPFEARALDQNLSVFPAADTYAATVSRRQSTPPGSQSDTDTMLLDESEDMFTQDAWLGMKKCVGSCPVLPLSSRVVYSSTECSHTPLLQWHLSMQTSWVCRLVAYGQYVDSLCDIEAAPGCEMCRKNRETLEHAWQVVSLVMSWVWWWHSTAPLPDFLLLSLPW